VSRKSKNDGNRFERKCEELFRDAGWISNRFRSFGIQGEPDLYASKNGHLLDIQAKSRQNLNVHGTLVDLIRAQGLVPGQSEWAVPCVVYQHVEKTGPTERRMQEGPITITMPLDDFLRMVGMSTADMAGVQEIVRETIEQLREMYFFDDGTEEE